VLSLDCINNCYNKYNMKTKYQQTWNLALPYLKKGKMKDFVIHTQGVVKAMELLIGQESEDSDILIPAAILHDVGFSKVPIALQTNSDLDMKREAQRQHLVFAKNIIESILSKVGYSDVIINKIVDIVEAHKFTDPRELDRRLLIDADNLSDCFKDQFYSDVKMYKSTPDQVYNYRLNNEYYTKTAKKIADQELKERFKEINS
jgi:hypothetical protein